MKMVNYMKNVRMSTDILMGFIDPGIQLVKSIKNAHIIMDT